MRLKFSEVLSESFSFFFANIRLFFDLVTIPWVLSIAIRIVGGLLSIDLPLGALVEKAMDVVPTAMFAVAWQRRAAGTAPHRAVAGTGLVVARNRLARHLLKVAGMTFVLMAVFMMTVGPMDPRALRAGAAIDPDNARRYALAGPLAFGFIVSLLLALRVSWGLAATAVDVPFSPRCPGPQPGQRLAHHRRPVRRLFRRRLRHRRDRAADPRRDARLLQAEEAAAIVSWTVAILVSYGVVALTATVQAVIFRRLLAWREGAGLPALSDLKKVAQQSDQGQVGRRHRIAGKLDGATHFRAWPSWGCGVPFHLRQAKTGISR